MKLNSTAVFVGLFVSLATVVVLPFLIPGRSKPPPITIAFLGNSIQYYNDFPRVMEFFGQGRIIKQNSCLRGGSTFTTLLERGSGTAYKFNSTNALLPSSDTLYDYGACTIPQLLFGHDDNLNPYNNNDDDNDNINDDDGSSIYQYAAYGDLNPCFANLVYYDYLKDSYDEEPSTPHWDYIVMNDNTLGPAIQENREEHLQTLIDYYVPWFQQLIATDDADGTTESPTTTTPIPIFIHTHAYWTLEKMGDYESVLKDIPTFTSKTYAGIQLYVNAMTQYLPTTTTPRIAPVGIAFLLIWEENYEFWESKMFHTDKKHPSPHGTFLQACIVYYTIYGRMPSASHILFSPKSIWKKARYMQPLPEIEEDSTAAGTTDSIPTIQDAQYLYRIAERVCKRGVIPKSFIYYENEGDLNNDNDEEDEQV